MDAMLRTAAAVVAALALLSCAATPPPHAAGPAARDYFPMLPGAHWVYEMRTGLFTHTKLEVTSRGERPVRDSDSGMFVFEEQADGELFGLEPAGLVGYRVSGAYVTRIAAIELGSDGVVHLFGHGAVAVLPVNPESGQHWSDQVDVFDGSGAAPQRWTAEVENVGRVHVAAGTFDDVIVVRSASWDLEWKNDEPLHSYEDYYARGVGLIRSVAHNHTRFLPIAEMEQELVEVRFDQGEGAAVSR